MSRTWNKKAQKSTTSLVAQKKDFPSSDDKAEGSNTLGGGSNNKGKDPLFQKSRASSLSQDNLSDISSSSSDITFPKNMPGSTSASADMTTAPFTTVKRKGSGHVGKGKKVERQEMARDTLKEGMTNFPYVKRWVLPEEVQEEVERLYGLKADSYGLVAGEDNLPAEPTRRVVEEKYTVPQKRKQITPSQSEDEMVDVETRSEEEVILFPKTTPDKGQWTLLNRLQEKRPQKDPKKRRKISLKQRVDTGLSMEEQRNYMDHGLCFKCGAKGHRQFHCPRRQDDVIGDKHASHKGLSLRRTTLPISKEIGRAHV